ncbi:ARM repeat-containing protein [Lojkania enalia]|uniref:ARM repeat-containing protein n=1 Tax=Lojkania enalia TaxID=147567 RepID=A0A9P4N1K0_9PLEO|nr:ARM repeat-containing protein [Didymosphaeria enalia]
MGRSFIPPALIELSNPSTPEAQVNALRNLKNEIVGHDQRKELAVRHGVVKPLAGILRTEARKDGKRRRGAMNGNSGAGRDGDKEIEWNTEDELRFQATLVVGSLVNGGPAFVAPLLAGSVLPPLIEVLSLAETPPKLIVATLRTLNQIADAIAHEKPWTDSSDGPLQSSLTSIVTEHLYTRPVMESFSKILSQAPGSTTVQQQISLVIKLITKTCGEDKQRNLLVEVGILDSLSTKLAAIASVDALSLKMEAKASSRDELPLKYLHDVLEGICVIIQDSYYYTARFFYSAAIQQLFGSSKDNSSSSYDAYQSSQTSWDRLIPRLQTIQSKPDAYMKSWPPLGSYNLAGASDSYTRLPSMESVPTSRTVVTDESEHPLYIWLMFVARRGEGKERLSACWLLALLKKFSEKWSLNDPSKTTRERHFSYLVVPLVVKMIEEANPTSEQSKKRSSLSPEAREEHMFILEQSPRVLGELIAGNKALQNAAADARILPVLVQILKKSFDPVVTSSKPLWSPRPASPQIRDPMINPASSTLGRSGLSSEVLHTFRYREGVLLALAAIADSQDGLRKMVIETGAATYIIDSLIPYSEALSDPLSSTQNPGSTTPKDGNPVAVLVAACNVTRSLSRSISVLRTSLIDNGIAKPSFDLLTHPNVKVQIAATDVITNLVLEVSPMRPEIIEAGALKTLCEHCRSANFDLRCGSLWALKHLVLGLPIAMKIQCLNELGVGYLVQTLNGEPSKSAVSSPISMGAPNATGEQVDILNTVDEPHMDVDDEASSEDEDPMTDSIPSMRRHQRQGSRYTSASNVKERLQQIKSDEHDPRINAERDDIRIQEQALDFIRNFITEDRLSGDTIDHILTCFGHTRFFELMSAKLRPKGAFTSPGGPSYWSNNNTTSTPRSSFATTTNPSLSQSNVNWAAYPAHELIMGTLYILVHVANGRPQHRSLLIAQTQLMNHILPLLSHPNRNVRLPCAWFICNLAWVEDANDMTASRERAISLRQLGFEEGARRLGQDADLDIRERAKTAIEQLENLMKDGSGYGSPRVGGGLIGDGGVSALGRVGSGLGGLHSHRSWRDGNL